MQITVNIPDVFAAQVEAQGLSPEAYVERLIEQTAKQRATYSTEKLPSMEEFDAALDGLTRHSGKIPSLPVDVFSRENLYSDHD